MTRTKQLLSRCGVCGTVTRKWFNHMKDEHPSIPRMEWPARTILEDEGLDSMPKVVFERMREIRAV